MSETTITIDENADFETLVSTIQAREGCDRRQAIRKAVRQDPQAHRIFLLRANANRPRAQDAILSTLDRDLQAARSAATPGSGDPVAVWNELVDGYAKATGSRARATSMAARRHPEAHREMLVAYNSARGHACNR